MTTRADKMEFTQFLDLFNRKSSFCVFVDMARPSKPKTELAHRLIELRGKMPRDDFARSIKVIPGTYANYERGDSEPNGTVLLNLVRVHGLNLHWLFTGQGSMLIGGDVKAGDVSIAQVRKMIYNIAFSAAGKSMPRNISQEAFAEYFLAAFDLLNSLEKTDENSASKVVEFGAEQLKRASDRDDQ